MINNLKSMLKLCLPFMKKCNHSWDRVMVIRDIEVDKFGHSLSVARELYECLWCEETKTRKYVLDAYSEVVYDKKGVWKS